MKICNVTMIGYNNYGNRLQNYAINKYVKNAFDCEVYTLWKHEQGIVIKNIIKTIIPGKKNYVKRFYNFYKFNKLYISKYYCNLNNFVFSKEKTKFDFFIVGSDQVWNYNYLKNFPKDGGFDLFLLKNIDGEKCVSYAPSLGVSEISDPCIELYSKELKKFKSISVREDVGKSILEAATDRKDIDVLIDPTMLLKSEEWDEISKKPKLLKYNKYILNYFLGELSDSRKKEIERIAKDNECDIINILDKNDPFYASGPSEFLWLEKNAFLICTDSFHSSVFAILYNKPFIVFDREQKGIENMNSRIDTLINKFKLENRRYNGTNITKENLNHDYTEAYKILENERKKSYVFLRKALDIKE